MPLPFTYGPPSNEPRGRSRRKPGAFSAHLAAIVLLAAATGCADEKDAEFTALQATAEDVASDSGQATSTDLDDSSTRAPASDSAPPEDSGTAADACRPGPGATGNPRTIVEVIRLINSLPMPVTIPCFLQSLDRPISLVATASVISAQPANGQDNPRLFLLRDGISLSVVPSGDVSHLLELGELTSNTTSIKGELAFPVTEPLALDAAFTHVARPAGGTVCYVCHHGEAPVTDYPADGAFESVAYRPTPRLEINFDYVEYQYETCDATLEPDRCALLSALFTQGDISRGEFPEEMPTFE